MIVAAPVATAVTKPVEDTVAVLVLDDDHVTVLVKLVMEPSEYTPVAVSCCVSPAGTFAARGVIVTATSTAGSTVITAVPERAAAESVAVIVAAPVATAVTKPVDDTVAVPVLDDDHVTVWVRLVMEPSEYTPIAAICCVSPAGTFATGGDTDTATNTFGNTVITAVPERAAAESPAVMVAAPVATAVARPVEDTDAVDGLEDDHVTVPVRSVVEPSEYTPVASNCCDAPTGTLAAGGATVTATNTFGNTVMTAAPDRSAAESAAVIVAAPVATAITDPVEETVAVPVLDDDHVTELVKLTVEPSEYTPVASNCCDSPTGTLAAGGDTVTATNTFGSTVITAVPEMSDDGSVAVIVVAPVATAVTKPVEDTVAVAGVEDDHVTELVRFAVEPSEYTPIAASCWVSPTGTLAAAGVIVTATNTFGSTVITAVPERAAAESVAVIVAAPVATAVTRPVEDTVAVPVLDDDHVTTSVKLAVEPSE